MSTSHKPHAFPRRMLFIATVTLFASALGCADPFGANEEVVTLDIASALVPCQGMVPQECYRVRQQPDTNWTFFYDEIQGFDYEPGFEYTITVVRSSVHNPPADGSSFAYRLLSILRKEPA